MEEKLNCSNHIAEEAAPITAAAEHHKRFESIQHLLKGITVSRWVLSIFYSKNVLVKELLERKVVTLGKAALFI